MPLKKKRVSAFEVKCKETVIDERTKNKHKSDKPKSKHVKVVDAINSLPKEKQIEYVKSGNKKKSRKSNKGKKSAKANSISPKAVAKTKQKSEQEDNGDTNVSMVVIDDDNEESDIASDLVDIQAGEKTVDINRPEDNKNTDSDSMDSDVHRKHENINKRKIGSLENDKTAVVKKKSKRDFNKDSEIQPSEKSIEESVDDRDDWTDIGRRLQSRAGYGDHFDSGKPSTHKSPIAIPVGDSVLVIASHPCVFPLKGVVTIQAVVGTASVMEYNLVPGSQGYDVYSPDCNSLVTVSTVKGVTKTKTAVNQVDSMLGINDKTVINLLKNSLNDSKPFVVLKFDKLKTTLCSFISNFHPYTNIFKVDGDKTLLNKQLLPLSVKMPGEDMDVPEISVSEQLQNVLDVWQGNLIQQNEGVPAMLVCGGKDSGKSTSNRLLINSTLNRCKSVYYLECDIGQTEFTPPGVVSLVKVTTPVLGPPFTHQRKAVCSYHYGSVSPKDNADLYMRCVQLCVQEYKRVEQKTPLIVNTMGWMKGLGWQLLLDIIRLVSPSIMVQLMSYQVSQNVPPITVEDLEQTSWTELSKMFKGENIERKMERIPTFLSLEGPISTSYNFRMKPTDYRNLSILSHLGANLEPGLTLTSMTPFTVSWKDVAIHMCHVQVPKSQVMCALNANMVALCEGDVTKAELYEDDGPLFLKKNKQPFRWISYGLVRGIDMVKKKFYIVTSLSEEELARINVLDIGGISLPENFLITQKGERIPYVDEIVKSKGLSAVKPRKHMPRKGLRGNNQ